MLTILTTHPYWSKQCYCWVGEVEILCIGPRFTQCLLSWTISLILHTAIVHCSSRGSQAIMEVVVAPGSWTDWIATSSTLNISTSAFRVSHRMNPCCKLVAIKLPLTELSSVAWWADTCEGARSLLTGARVAVHSFTLVNVHLTVWTSVAWLTHTAGIKMAVHTSLVHSTGHAHTVVNASGTELPCEPFLTAAVTGTKLAAVGTIKVLSTFHLKAQVHFSISKYSREGLNRCRGINLCCDVDGKSVYEFMWIDMKITVNELQI